MPEAPASVVATRRRRRLLIAVFFVSALAVAGFATWQTLRRAHGPTGTRASGLGLSARGTQFSLSFSQELKSAGGPPKRVVIEGMLQSTASERPGVARFVRAYRLMNARVSGPNAAAGSDQDFAREVSRPFLVECERGRPEHARFRPDVSVAARNMLLTVAAELPCEQPRIDKPVVTTERDLFGRYLGAVTPDADHRGFERRKLRYVDLGVPDSSGLKTAMSITIGSAVWKFRFTAARALESVRGEEQLTIETGFPGLAPETRTEIVLAPRGDLDAEPIVAEVAESEASLVATPIVTQKVESTRSARAEDEARVGTASLAELVAAFPPNGPEQAAMPLAARREAVERLASYLRLHPNAVAEVVAHVRKEPVSAQDLIDALGLAKLPLSRVALSELALDTRAPLASRVAALGTLAHNEPDAGTLAALEPLFDDSEPTLREAAVMTYGALLRAWRKLDPAAAEPALQKLSARLDAATDAAGSILALRGLGNAADAASLPTVQRALGSPEPTVRKAAVQALRIVMAPGVDQTITETMQRDPNPGVRASAIFAASFRNVTTYADALAEVAQRDSDAQVRAAAIDQLARVLETAPRVREVLTWVSKNDPKPDLRKRAAHLLASPPAR